MKEERQGGAKEENSEEEKEIERQEGITEKVKVVLREDRKSRRVKQRRERVGTTRRKGRK